MRIDCLRYLDFFNKSARRNCVSFPDYHNRNNGSREPYIATRGASSEEMTPIIASASDVPQTRLPCTIHPNLDLSLGLVVELPGELLKQRPDWLVSPASDDTTPSA